MSKDDIESRNPEHRSVLLKIYPGYKRIRNEILSIVQPYCLEPEKLDVVLIEDLSQRDDGSQADDISQVETMGKDLGITKTLTCHDSLKQNFLLTNSVSALLYLNFCH